MWCTEVTRLMNMITGMAAGWLKCKRRGQNALGAKESVQTRIPNQRGNLIDMGKEVMSHSHDTVQKGRRVKEETWLAWKKG